MDLDKRQYLHAQLGLLPQDCDAGGASQDCRYADRHRFPLLAVDQRGNGGVRGGCAARSHRQRYEIPAGVKVLELGYRQTGYDTDFSGSFTCDDEAFNQLWMESLYTLYITMRDNYMDCPDRERAQWWGDVTNESLMTFYSLDPDSYLLYRKGVDTLIGWRGHNGKENVLPTVVPINQGHFELPMQQLAGLVGFWTYYQ